MTSVHLVADQFIPWLSIFASLVNSLSTVQPQDVFTAWA
jgi:hypothetical protein